MITIGIDPGQTGAIAAIDDRTGKVIALHDMPVSARLHGSGQQVNASQLTSILLGIKNGSGVNVKLEAVSAMPKQGVSSMFRLGEALGVVLGVVGALQLPMQWIGPTKWKKAAGISNKEKDASRTLAIQRHPEVSDMLTRKRDNGRSDAICIAEFG